MKEPYTPTLDRIGEASDISQQIGEFLDWLINERGLSICDEFAVDVEVGDGSTYCPICDQELELLVARWSKSDGELRVDREDPPRYYWPVISGGPGIRRLLYQFYDIDQDEAEKERRMLLAMLSAEAQA